VRIDNVPVAGRVVTINRKNGTASNYDCCTCPCPASSYPINDEVIECDDPEGWCSPPISVDVAVNGGEQLYAIACYVDCNGVGLYDTDMTDDTMTSWWSDDSSIATVDTGYVSGQSAGTTTVYANYGGGCADWYFDGYDQCECDMAANGQSSATVNVGDGTPVVSSISPSPWVSSETISNGTISGQYFGTNPSVSTSDTGINAGLSYSVIDDGHISYSVTIPATTPTETVTITVTSQGYNGSGFQHLANDPGQSPSGNNNVGNTAPYPVSFTEAGWGKQGCCTLEFTYTWGSSTGNKADLSVCTMDEYVTSSLGTGTVNWPYPMVEQIAYPITGGQGWEEWLATDGFDSDEHLPPTSFNTPYATASFTDTQIYRYHCPGVNNGNWVTLAGPFSIVRSVSQTNGVWQYKVTKADGSVTWNLP